MAAVAVSAGALRDRVTIQQLAAGQDTIGQPVNTWSAVAAVWADIRHPRGLEAITGGAETSTAMASIRIRYRNDLTAAMRVLSGSAVYQIKAVLPEKRLYVDLVCERIT